MSASHFTFGQDMTVVNLSRLLVRNDTRCMSQHATSNQKLELLKKRERIQSRIDAYHANAPLYFHGIELDIQPNEWMADNAEDQDHDDEDNPFISQVNAISEEVDSECVPILLPSTIGLEKCLAAGLSEIVKKELTLRQGQANDALQGIRMALGKKSFLFRNNLRKSTSKVEKLRSWTDIGLVEAGVKHQAQIYRRARQALIALEASADIMKRYQKLTQDDLRTSTAVVNLNARGQRKTHLAWFWSMDIEGDTAKDGLMTECAQHSLFFLMKSVHDRVLRQFIV